MASCGLKVDLPHEIGNSLENDVLEKESRITPQIHSSFRLFVRSVCADLDV